MLPCVIVDIKEGKAEKGKTMRSNILPSPLYCEINYHTIAKIDRCCLQEVLKMMKSNKTSTKCSSSFFNYLKAGSGGIK